MGQGSSVSKDYKISQDFERFAKTCAKNRPKQRNTHNSTGRANPAQQFSRIGTSNQDHSRDASHSHGGNGNSNNPLCNYSSKNDKNVYGNKNTQNVYSADVTERSASAMQDVKLTPPDSCIARDLHKQENGLPNNSSPHRSEGDLCISFAKPTACPVIANGAAAAHWREKSNKDNCMPTLDKGSAATGAVNATIGQLQNSGVCNKSALCEAPRVMQHPSRACDNTDSLEWKDCTQHDNAQTLFLSHNVSADTILAAPAEADASHASPSSTSSLDTTASPETHISAATSKVSNSRKQRSTVDTVPSSLLPKFNSIPATESSAVASTSKKKPAASVQDSSEMSPIPTAQLLAQLSQVHSIATEMNEQPHQLQRQQALVVPPGINAADTDQKTSMPSESASLHSGGTLAVSTNGSNNNRISNNPLEADVNHSTSKVTRTVSFMGEYSLSHGSSDRRLDNIPVPPQDESIYHNKNIDAMSIVGNNKIRDGPDSLYSNNCNQGSAFVLSARQSSMQNTNFPPQRVNVFHHGTTHHHHQQRQMQSQPNDMGDGLLASSLSNHKMLNKRKNDKNARSVTTRTTTTSRLLPNPEIKSILKKVSSYSCITRQLASASQSDVHSDAVNDSADHANDHKTNDMLTESVSANTTTIPCSRSSETSSIALQHDESTVQRPLPALRSPLTLASYETKDSADETDRTIFSSPTLPQKAKSENGSVRNQNNNMHGVFDTQSGSSEESIDGKVVPHASDNICDTSMVYQSFQTGSNSNEGAFAMSSLILHSLSCEDVCNNVTMDNDSGQFNI